MSKFSSDNEQKIIEFADKYLTPYKIRAKHNGSKEIVPELCPFCKGGNSHDKGTFALSTTLGVYVCKRGSCGVTGVFDQLAEFFGDETRIEKSENSYIKQSKQYVTPDTEIVPTTEQIYKYFESRKISRDTVDAFGIGADVNGMIVFPFYYAGELIYEKFRRPWKPKPEEKGSKEWAFPGAKSILFGMDMCVLTKPLIITEGMIDCMSLYEAGIRNVVSVPSGCSNLDWIENCWDWLDRFNSIILFGDNDEPGREMIKNIVKRLDESRCRIVEDYPKRDDGTEMKDANEILYFDGWASLISMVANAKEIPVKGLIDLSDVTPIDPTTIPRIATNIPDLDRCLGGLQAGAVSIWTGKAGQGKSTYSGLFMLNGIEQGHHVCAYSGELSSEKYLEWINQQAAGSEYITLKYDPIKKTQVPFVPYAVQQRLLEYYKGKFFLFDNREVYDGKRSDAILNVFLMAYRKHACDLFVVDNLLTALSDESEDENRVQARFINRLLSFAKRTNSHVMVVAHPRKTKVQEHLGQDDVGGAGAIVNLADFCVAVEKPDLRILKNRDGGTNKLIQCCYCPDSRRAYQANEGDKNSFSWNKEGIPLAKPRADSLPEYQIQLSENMTAPF